MKKLLFVAAIIGVATFVSCKKKDSTTPSYSCTNCTTTPDAKAANNTISKGVYKGVVVGSSGTIKFDIMNNDSTIKAYMVIDSVSVTLTASVSWVAGQSYVSPFVGTMNGQPVSITFQVNADGSSPTVTSMSIPGHPNAVLTVSKETSDNLIKCFEGTVKNNTTGETGTLNLMLSVSLKKWGAIVRPANTSSSTSSVNGTFDGTTLKFDDGQGSSGSATLSGDQIINGTWQNNKPENGTWSCNRTL